MPPRRPRRTRAGDALRHLLLRGRVEAYVDGELLGAQRARTGEHISRCARCGCQAGTLLLIKHALQRARS